LRSPRGALSRGGRTTKIHAAVDERGRPRRLIVRPGHRGDAPAAFEMVASFTPQIRLADAACDSNALRAAVIDRSTLPVIPSNPTHKAKHPFDRAACKAHNVVERTFSRLKDWRRIATRFDKIARNFHAAVRIAAVACWL
jgi:transposase